MADFGLTRIISEGSTHKGISGYSAPQIVSGKVSETCDVFSFGVLMIELISGKKPIERVSGGKQAIMHWARPLVSQGRFHDLVDAKLEGKFHKGELTRLVQVLAYSASPVDVINEVRWLVLFTSGFADLLFLGRLQLCVRRLSPRKGLLCKTLWRC